MTVRDEVLATLKEWAMRQRTAYVVDAPRGRDALVVQVPEGYRVERVLNGATLAALRDEGLIEIVDDSRYELDLIAGMPSFTGGRRAPYSDTGRKITLTSKGRIA